MRVSELYHGVSGIRNQDVYVVGLGPSMSVFPIQLLENKVCILLNDAHRIYPTLGPIAFANHRDFLQETSRAIDVQIVKGRLKSDPNPEQDDNHVLWADPARFVFSYRMAPHDPIDHYDERLLFAEGEEDYYWRGPVAVFACQFAILAGARSIILVGCDCAPLANLDYCDPRVEQWRHDLSKNKKVRNREAPIRHNYEDYASGLLIVKREAERRFNVPIVSLTPFMGIVDPHEQLKLMRRGWLSEHKQRRKERQRARR